MEQRTALEHGTASEFDENLDLNTDFNLEPNAKLNLFHCPFVHRVIAHEDLHPRLQTLVDEISRITKLARTNAAIKAWWIGGIALPTPIFYASLAGCVVTDMVVFGKHISSEDSSNAQDRKEKVETAFMGDHSRFLSERAESLAEINKDARPDGLLKRPYRAASELTRQLGGVIGDLVVSGEKPFDTQDCGDLLAEFDCGIVDNAGNIVLIKDPGGPHAFAESGIGGLIRRLQFAQPFQRARFEL